MFEWLFGKSRKKVFTLGDVVVEIDTETRYVKVIQGFKISSLMLDDITAITWSAMPGFFSGYMIRFMVAGTIGVEVEAKWQPDHSRHSELVKFIKKAQGDYAFEQIQGREGLV